MSLTVLDATGSQVIIPSPNENGQQNMAGSRPVTIASDQSSLNTTPSNIVAKFRDAFETLDGQRWTTTPATGDILQVDGNAAAASYLSISKSPWHAGSETTIESVDTFGMPIELAFGAHMSQRTLGQEFSVEIVDTSTPLADVPNIAISSIVQSATTLTVDTTAPHGLTPGKSIGICNCSNPLANYPALVVASIPSPTQFTATAGPGGTIASQTIANPAGAKGEVYFRERLGRANNGASQIFENPTVTNASLYVRSESGDALPSGVVVGSHAVTVGTTASVQTVNAPNTYAFSPTSEFRINLQADRLQWFDSAVDATTQTTSRGLRTQVCPDPSETYKLRIRATNNKSLTVLTAKVTSVVKTGTTTGTFTTSTPHGLVTNDQIVYYGNSNTAASAFPSLVAATAVTVLSSTTFTAVIGTAATVTGYGGVIAKVHGGNLLSALGANAISVVNATLSTRSDSTRQLVLTGSGSWAGLVIGDYVNAEGLSNVTNGALLGVDGVYKVSNASGTALTLIPVNDSIAAGLPSNFALTTCGGAVVKRTCFRVSFIRIFDYERHRVEMLSRPSGDLGGAAPVSVQGGTVGVSGLVAVSAGAANVGFVGLQLSASVADAASAAITTTATTATITPSGGIGYQVNIPVTVVSGTTPTLDVRIEESDDGGTNWFTVYDFPRITAVGIYRSPHIPVNGNRVRYVQTIGGTTPSFTRAINRLQTNYPAPTSRQLIDRTIVATTLNSTTPSLLTQDCGNRAQIVVNMGTITTTAPQFQLEGSDDGGATWYAVGSAITGVASSTVQATVTNINSALIRARVSTAGVDATLGYVLLKAQD